MLHPPCQTGNAAPLRATQTPEVPCLIKDLSVSCWSAQQVASAAGAAVMTAAAAGLINSLSTALMMKGRWAEKGLVVSCKHLNGKRKK